MKYPKGENNRQQKFYHDKNNKHDALLYDKLSSIVARFITIEALKEVAHAGDTCANESFNNTIAWVAPKNKVYCGSYSLANRISICIGIKLMGLQAFYEQLFQ